MKLSISILLILAMLCACLCGCVDENKPYDPGTPEPAVHDGLFTSEHGSLRFNGDGKTVTIDFDEYLARLTGLPTGETEGTTSSSAATCRPTAAWRSATTRPMS